MKATDLRINNIVNGIDDILILSKWEFKRHVIEDSAENIWPIELTEEWLLEFGFKKGLSSVIHERQDYALNPIGISSYSGENKFHVNGYLVVIKYVHQLQNLYFALTNEELTLTKQP